jgi:hypothetical protein
MQTGCDGFHTTSHTSLLTGDTLRTEEILLSITSYSYNLYDEKINTSQLF